MIGERDARGIEHLQEEIPYQAVGFFDFVEKQNASLVLRENVFRVVQRCRFRHP